MPKKKIMSKVKNVKGKGKKLPLGSSKDDGAMPAMPTSRADHVYKAMMKSRKK